VENTVEILLKHRIRPCLGLRLRWEDKSCVLKKSDDYAT